MPTTSVSTRSNPASRSSARRAVAATTIALLSFAGSQIPAATAHAAPSVEAVTIVRPNWGYCSTPGVPC
ncbi:hypothetical protein [Aquihabitans sp. McL0605]|uniref:hypothetical protein n=1 Tax=Aquihabitans sp. McL0605 TaxID=3415671 RepID=UPI003CF30B63